MADYCDHGYFWLGHHIYDLSGWKLGSTEMVVGIHNVKIFTEDGSFVPGQVSLEDGIIKRVEYTGKTTAPQVGMESSRKADEYSSGRVIDGKGAYLIPGLIDIHLHGCMGEDFCDGNRKALDTLARVQAAWGVTSIAPATMTLPVEELEHILTVAADYRDWLEKEADQKEKACRADLVGINMEGPFISVEKKGAQAEENIIAPDPAIGHRFLEASRGLVKYMGVAPEAWGEAWSFIEEMKEKVHVTLAHTGADYDTAKKAFGAGIKHIVHFYNAMSPFLNREPGIPGAVFDSPDVNAELICDGFHIHPSVIRTTFRLLGKDRIILISDSMRAAGLGPGTYTLGGQEVIVGENDNVARLASTGGIAASVTNLMECVRRLVLDMGIPLGTAVACASVNPAKSLGIYDWCGSVSEGKKANLVMLGENLELEAVIKDGYQIDRHGIS